MGTARTRQVIVRIVPNEALHSYGIGVSANAVVKNRLDAGGRSVGWAIKEAVMSDVWAVSDSYESYVGRWSRLVASVFVDWFAPPHRQRWLDVGCGTGALTSQILARCEPLSVLGVDPSEQFIRWTSARVHDQRVHFTIGDATGLPLQIADIVVSG